MIFSKRIYSLTVVFILCAAIAKAQDKPIGYWRSHLPYNIAIGIATNGSTIYTACDMAYFTIDPLKNGAPQPYSKVEGMSDIGMQCVGYDIATSTAILVYTNGNIDLFKDNTFYNIPDLKVKNVAGSKNVYGVYTENGIAYLSTSLGVLVIDLSNYNITETYQFIKNNRTIPVTGFIGAGTYFYVTTPDGLYRAPKNNPELQNFQVWQKIDSAAIYTCTAFVNNTLFLSDTSHVFAMINDTVRSIYTSPIKIPHIDAGNNSLLVCEFNPPHYNGGLKVIGTDYRVIDSYYCNGDAVQALQLTDSSIWLADAFNGLVKVAHGQTPAYFYPVGPNNINSFDIYANNKNLWVAHGGYNGNYIPHGWSYGMSDFFNDKWHVYSGYNYGPFSDSVNDLVTILKDEKDGTIYAGSYSGGLFILKQDGSTRIIKQNSLFDSSISVFGSGQRQVIGLALDKSDNLWVSLAFAQHQLYVKTPDNTWYKFLVPNASNGGPIAIDDNGQVWFACISGGGIAVYYSGDLTTLSDDKSYHLSTGIGYGNLPSNNVFCLAKDKSNNIWVGTDNGIGIVSNCSEPFNQSSAPCDAEIPIVQYDQFAGYLFAGNNVRSIAVDGANRKWVGTDNGVWLLSSDASQIVYRFTSDNSPLPSNVIEKITIDGVTGDVYIGTDHGLVSYRSTATDGGTSNQDVLIFPDPVPSGYKGTIAIKGLAANADVRITDIGGQLVYRTKAFGGQAVWNGLDYKGHRPQTGIYLIFVSSSDGSQTYVGKIMFMQ